MLSAALAHRLLVAGGLVLMPGVVLGQDYRYALVELRVLNPSEQHSWTRAISDSGELVGASSTDAVGFHAAIWNPTGITDLGTLAGERSEARGLNSDGLIVGWSTYIPGNTSARHAVIWHDGQIIDLGTLGGERSEANAINRYGQIVGFAQTPESGGAFIWEDGLMSQLPTLGRNGGTAHDINGASEVVGSSWPIEGNERAVVWRNSEVFALVPLHSDPSAAIAINDLSQIVGQSRDRTEKTHAVAWVNELVFDLHLDGLGPASSAWGINNLGQIVGWVGTQPADVKGFLWEQGTGMRTLDSLMPPKLRRNWRIDMAWDINDAGQIAAQGYVIGQPLKAYPFLLTPVAPTMELSSPVPGAAPGPNTLTLTGATPGARVVFLYSLHSGGTRIPGCDLQQNALQLDNPQIIGTAIADGNGEATITRSVPVIARGQTILFQAVVQNECAISQLVVHQFD